MQDLRSLLYNDSVSMSDYVNTCSYGFSGITTANSKVGARGGGGGRASCAGGGWCRQWNSLAAHMRVMQIWQ